MNILSKQQYSLLLSLYQATSWFQACVIKAECFCTHLATVLHHADANEVAGGNRQSNLHMLHARLPGCMHTSFSMQGSALKRSSLAVGPHIEAGSRSAGTRSGRKAKTSAGKPVKAQAKLFF